MSVTFSPERNVYVEVAFHASQLESSYFDHAVVTESAVSAL